MSVSVSKAGPYYASGEIKFSSLRSNFRAQQRKTTSGGSETFNTDNAAISASDLLRNTDTAEQNPIVPDSTENNNVATSNIRLYAIALKLAETELELLDPQVPSINMNLLMFFARFVFQFCVSMSKFSSVPDCVI